MNLSVSLSLVAEMPLWGMFWGLLPDEWEFRGQSLPRYLPFVLGMLGVVAVGVLYAKEIGRLSVGRRLVLAGIRMATVAAVAALLLKPVLVWQDSTDRNAGRSPSSSTCRRAWRAGSAAGARRSVACRYRIQPHRSRQGLSPQGADQFHGAEGEDARPPDADRDRPPCPHQPRTRASTGYAGWVLWRSTRSAKRVTAAMPSRPSGCRLSRPINRTLNSSTPRSSYSIATTTLPAAIVLVTDGRENASDKSPAELAAKCRDKGIPLHIYGVGSSSFGQLSGCATRACRRRCSSTTSSRSPSAMP